MGEYMQEYMQGWYKEYCQRTGEFCDQVKLYHTTKDKETDQEIVYNVPSSSGHKNNIPAKYNNKDISVNDDIQTQPTSKPLRPRRNRKKIMKSRIRNLLSMLIKKQPKKEKTVITKNNFNSNQMSSAKFNEPQSHTTQTGVGYKQAQGEIIYEPSSNPNGYEIVEHYLIE